MQKKPTAVRTRPPINGFGGHCKAGEDWHTFLEGEVGISKPGALICRFVVKGASHLQQPPFKLLKPRFKSWSSYGPLDQKRSLLTSNVVRSMGYTMPTVCDTAVVLHALQLIQVLLYWPPVILFDSSSRQ